MQNVACRHRHRHGLRSHVTVSPCVQSVLLCLARKHCLGMGVGTCADTFRMSERVCRLQNAYSAHVVYAARFPSPPHVSCIPACARSQLLLARTAQLHAGQVRQGGAERGRQPGLQQRQPAGERQALTAVSGGGCAPCWARMARVPMRCGDWGTGVIFRGGVGCTVRGWVRGFESCCISRTPNC